MKLVLALAVTVLSIQARAVTCQITHKTASDLLYSRKIELPPQALYQNIREVLLNDPCVQAKRLRASEVHAVIQKVLDYRIQDKFLVGEINEYLAM